MMNSKSNVDSPAAKKRERDTDNDSEGIDEAEASALAQMTRSQRKCHRERRRRSEVNKGFDDLTSLLWEIDSATMRTEVESRALRGKKTSNFPSEEVVFSRVDLINLTISLLRRLNNENEQRKGIISTLTRPETTGLGRESNLRNITGVASSQQRQSSLETLGISPQQTPAFERNPQTLPATSIDSNQIYQQRYLLDHFSSSHPTTNTGIPTRSLNFLDLYSQSLLNQHNENSAYTSGRASVGPRTLLQQPAGISGSYQSTQLPSGSGNSDVIATFLAQQQHTRNMPNVENNKTNPIPSSGPGDDSLGRVGSTDLTRQLLQIIQNRPADSGVEGMDVNLQQIESFLRNQLQQKPPGRH